MKKNLKSFLCYELFLYFIFAIFCYLLKKYNHLDSWSLIAGVMLLPITNGLYDLLRKVLCKSAKNI